MHKNETVSRNLLTYLSKVPARLAHSRHLNAPEAYRRLLAEVALDIGNCLLWLHPHVDPDGPRHEQPLNESADSVWALAKQFRAVGLDLWDSPPWFETEVQRLAHIVTNMSAELGRLAEKIDGKDGGK